MSVQTVLIVDDEEDIREICSEALLDAGYSVRSASSAAEAIQILKADVIDIVLTDVNMPELTGLDLLHEITGQNVGVDVIFMTAHATVETAVEAMKAGAYDYITKPFHVDDLVARVSRLTDRRDLMADNNVLRQQVKAGRGPGGMIGTSAPMQELYRMILKVAPRRQPVLIIGESGSGKELVARGIHESGPNRTAPFIALDCAALSSTLMESELFGHVPGAFTGAMQKRIGMLATAGQGTLLLDEIGELPIDLQAKLLRAIQEREFRPLGSNQMQKFEARIVAATHRDLQAAVRDGKFREDLFYRLNVLPVRTPPLRERKEDIPALVRFFLEREQGPGNSVTGISRAALGALMAHHWPGNIRELRNQVERAIAMCDGPAIELCDLDPDLAAGAPQLETPGPLTGMQLAERQAIQAALASSDGHRVEAANRLGIGKTTLYKKLKEYGL